MAEDEGGACARWLRTVAHPVVGCAGSGTSSASAVAFAREEGSVALLALLGGGLALLVALLPVVVVTDLMVARGRAQLAADAAALAAMGTGGSGREQAAQVARYNGGDLRSCCGDDPWRREVSVDVAPSSALLAAVVPAVRASAAAALTAATPPAVDGTAPGVAGRGVRAAGGRVWPVRAPLTSGFGMRLHPVLGYVRLHAGIDLGAPTGTPIGAASAGVIAFAGVMGGYGNVVDIRHADGTTTRYAHQSRILVRAGQQVAAGQIIGLVGNTGGASTGPHLHFEVRTASGPIDPHSWLPP